jgi:hypothetical protein
VDDEYRDGGVHQAVVDGVQEQREIDSPDGTGGERSAQACERERRERLGIGIAVRLRNHHRRPDEVGRNDACGGDDRLVCDDPSDHPAERDRDQGRVGRAHTALATADREQVDEARDDGLRAGHDQAPRGTVGPL